MAEEQLAESQTNITSILENSLESIWSVNTSYEIQYVNGVFGQAFKQSFGVELAKGVNIINALPDPLKEFWKLRYDKVFENETLFFNDVVPASGKRFFIEVSMSPIVVDGKVTGASAFSRDVTPQKLAEEELRRQKLHRQLLIEIALGYINVPLDNVESAINNSLAQMGEFVMADRSYIFVFDQTTGLCDNTHEWCREGIIPQINELQQIPLPEDWQKTFSQASTIYIPDVLALPQEGARAILEPQGIKSLVAVPMMNQGMCIGFIGFDFVGQYHNYLEDEKVLLTLYAELMVNVWERKHAEEVLIREKEKAEESEEKLSFLFDNMTQGVVYHNFTGEIIYANKAASDILGLSLDQLFGRSSMDPRWKAVNESGKLLLIDEFPEVVTRKTGQAVKDFLLGVYVPETEEYRWIIVNSTPKFKGSESRLHMVVVTFEDVTKRKAAEKALRESEERLRNLFETMPNGFYRSTPEGYYVDANPAYVRMLGYESLDELKQVHIHTDVHIHEKQREEILAENPEFINQIEVYRLKRKDGTPIWIEDNARYITDENGKMVFNEGICRDITERKLAEFQREQAEYRANLQRAGIVDLLVDDSYDGGNQQEALGRITKVLSEAMQVTRTGIWILSEDESALICMALFDNRKQNPIEPSVYKILASEHPEYFSVFQKETRLQVPDVLVDARIESMKASYLIPEGISSLLEAGILIEGKFKGLVSCEHTEGVRNWYPDEESFISTIAAMVAQFFLNHKRIQSESLLQSLIDHNPLSIQIINKEGYTLQVNDAFIRLFGVNPPEDYSVLNDLQVLSQGLIGLFDKVLVGETVQFPDFHYNVHDLNPEFPDKSVWVRMVIFPMLNTEGMPERFVMMHEDITLRKNAEEELKKSYSNLKKSQEIARVGNWTWDILANIFTASDEGYRLMGFPTGASLSLQEVARVIHPEDRIRVFKTLKAALKNGESFRFEMRILRKEDAELRHLLSMAEIE